MPLHAKTDIKAAPNADIYGTAAADVSVPKYKLGDHEMRPMWPTRWCATSFSWTATRGRIWRPSARPGSTTEVHQLMDLSIDKNMIDKDEYPATAELESRCVHILADLWHSPKAADTIGCSTTGSSEACMLGGLALKWKWRERMKAAGKPTDRPNLDHRPRAGLLAQIRPLLRRRAARDPAGARAARHDAGRSASSASTRTPSA